MRNTTDPRPLDRLPAFHETSPQPGRSFSTGDYVARKLNRLFSVRRLAMGNNMTVYRPPPSDEFHPLVYKAAAGFVLCFVVSAWVFFDRQNDIGELLGFASLLLFIAVLLPTVLWHVWRREQGEAINDSPPFRHWASGDFRVWQGQLNARHAMIDALLPLAAVAFGLAALGIVFALVATAS
jgi:hypothetical protein